MEREAMLRAIARAKPKMLAARLQSMGATKAEELADWRLQKLVQWLDLENDALELQLEDAR